MASLRNLAITILRLAGTTNIAEALRHNADDPTGHSKRSSSANPCSDFAGARASAVTTARDSSPAANRHCRGGRLGQLVGHGRQGAG